jgi:hypothetical protein
MFSLPLFSFLSVLFSGCAEQVEPNGTWLVTITGTGSDNPCIESTAGFQKEYDYALYFTGSFVEIRVDGEKFATGEIRGCSLNYESNVYLEENENGNFRWQIVGSADVESAAGGCPNVPDHLDWVGVETLTVVSSENPTVAESCTYNMESSGVLAP